MATKRGLCPFCTNKKITNRLFVVNPDAAVCYCPNCLNEMAPSQAIKTYADAIEDMVKVADKALFHACDPALAYQKYADILEIDNTCVRAYLGRLLCLVYLSKVRKSYIAEAGLLLDDEIDTYFHRVAEIPNLITFLKRVNRLVDEYEYGVHKKLTFKSYFFDKDCLSLYLHHLNEIIIFKTNALNECLYLQKKYSNVQADVLISLLETSLAEKKKLLFEGKFITVDGKTYVVDQVEENGNVTIKETDDPIVDTKSGRYLMGTLDINDKKNRYITDTVFKDYALMLKKDKVSIAFFVILLIMALTFGVLAFVFYKTLFAAFIVFLVLVGVSLLSSIISFTFHLAMIRQVKKRRASFN